MSFEFQVSEGEELTLESAVFQALGAASTCWENMEGTGVFKSDECKEIGDVLLKFIDEEVLGPVGLSLGEGP